ncbi:hypothetical protein H5410_031990 [Solanum commersonii]|uniref:Uncharacterized protein n=1 Tax=Solanum commersonii TaxID=4109 RepID=A0A9J5YNB9_SOLCO|nr:hypothetical protein H5410_031990 [Solanum commersonii]
MSHQFQATMTNLTQATLEMYLSMRSQATLRRVWILNPKLPLGEHNSSIIKLLEMVLAKPSHATMKES